MRARAGRFDLGQMRRAEIAGDMRPRRGGADRVAPGDELLELVAERLA